MCSANSFQSHAFFVMGYGAVQSCLEVQCSNVWLACPQRALSRRWEFLKYFQSIYKLLLWALLSRRLKHDSVLCLNPSHVFPQHQPRSSSPMFHWPTCLKTAAACQAQDPWFMDLSLGDKHKMLPGYFWGVCLLNYLMWKNTRFVKRNISHLVFLSTRKCRRENWTHRILLRCVTMTSFTN